jgi:DNA-binding IscR family transcriptional regulator
MYTSTRSKNAIRIVIDIMRSHESSSVSAIAQRQELPVIYTKNLLIALVKKARGGFKLGKAKEFIDIIRAVN